MRRRIEFALVVLVFALAGFVIFSKPARAPSVVPPPAKAGRAAWLPRETTLRNVTDRTLSYKISPAGDPGAVEARTIAPGAIDRIPASGALTVEFNTGEKDVVYSLDAGKPYSFRYDQGAAIDIFLGAHGRADAADLAPYVPTPSLVVDRMLELARPGPRDVLYDVGCGDGRIVIEAARKYGASGVGIDIDPAMVEASGRNARAAGVERLVRFVCQDAVRADLSPATVVTLYLLPESNALLRPLLERQLRPGVRVVSHNYMIAGWERKQTGSAEVKDADGTEHTIYVYVR